MADKSNNAIKQTYTKLDHHHTGMDVDSIEICFATHLKYHLAKDRYTASDRDRFMSLALVVRERMIERWIETQQLYHRENAKRIYYLSMEYLMGRSLANNAINLGMADQCVQAMEQLGLDFQSLRDQEVDAGLGNGGLGRLAACFMDSMATLALPATGYGLRYDYGIFRQEIENGEQKEEPDEWLRYGNIWEFERPEYAFSVHFGGHIEVQNKNGKTQHIWRPFTTIIGIPYDTPIIGYGCNNVNTLRLWSAKAGEDFDFEDFSQGDYVEAVKHKILAENLTKVLYPSDSTQSGKELRFRQQYFFVSCSLQDITRRFKVHNSDFTRFHEKVAIQLNDTHPAIAIPELMRILIDREGLPWTAAWDTTVRTFGYTNHTLLPEALERWSLDLVKRLLPRHTEIIFEINRRFLDKISVRYPGDTERLQRMSLISEVPSKQIRMAHLAVVGSHSVNGVAELHTRLLKKNLLHDFHEIFPDRINNKTNGITPRRWLLKANPHLAHWISEKIGEKWITDLEELRRLEPYADKAGELDSFRAIKLINKQRLATLIEAETGYRVNPEAIFDVHIKRLHEYKRQLLNILHTVILYCRLKRDPGYDFVPRVFIFGGKAAPGYFMAKQIIKLINAVGQVINEDDTIGDKLKVIFLPNYRVSLAERIIPASEISEQISTAGMEASGTGNMKLALNGALTIGTLDGANIEIQQEVGEDNIFIFGMNAEEIEALKNNGSYNPWNYYHQDAEIREALDLIFVKNFFSLHEPGKFDAISHALFDDGDKFFVLGDLRAYAECQNRVQELYRNQEEWNRKAILNVARVGRFSSDRVIRKYAEEIWKVAPLPVDLSHKRCHTVMQARADFENDHQ